MNNIIKLTKMSLTNFKAIYTQLLGIMIIWIGVTIINPDFVTMMAPIIVILSGIQIISYEDVSGVDYLVNIIPVSKKEYVLSRYLIGLGTIVLSTIIVFICYILSGDKSFNITELFASSILSSSIVVTIMIPCILKFGVLKAKIITMIISVISILITIPVMDMIQNPSQQANLFITIINKINPILMSIIVSTIMFVISIAICMKCYKNKEVS